jgi:alpha/beta superfamily hydrolase
VTGVEEPITFRCDNLIIEGRLGIPGGRRFAGRKAVVVTHPHPLYGGTMDNPVVEAVCRGYRRSGYATLRFNFRGAGQSQGRHEGGPGERRDVRAGIGFMAGRGYSPIDLAGYSFGAWVNAFIDCRTDHLGRMTMISPPAGLLDFEGVADIDCLRLVVTGGRDDIAPARMVAKLLEDWNREAMLEVIPEADHFYSGCLQALEGVLTARLGGSHRPD